jgi:hypothetical protein
MHYVPHLGECYKPEGKCASGKHKAKEIFYLFVAWLTGWMVGCLVGWLVGW